MTALQKHIQNTYRQQITTKHNKNSENITNKTKNITHTIPFKKRHPTIQASQKTVKAILQGNHLTTIKKFNNACIKNKKNKKQWKKLNNK